MSARAAAPPPAWHDAVPCIDLLSQRRTPRLLQRRYAITLVLLAGGGAMLAVVAGAAYVDHRLGQSRDEHAALTHDVARSHAAALDAAALARDIDTLRGRAAALDRLRRQRARPVRLLEVLARQMPPGLYLTALEQNGDIVRLAGVAQSNQRVSELLAVLAALPELMPPQLLESMAADGSAAVAEPLRPVIFKARVAYRGEPAASSVAARDGG